MNSLDNKIKTVENFISYLKYKWNKTTTWDETLSHLNGMMVTKRTKTKNKVF